MNKDKIKVMIVDDHSIVRFGIRSLIEKNDNMVVCSEADSIKSLLMQLGNVSPDIIILDLKLPDGDGIIGIREIKKLDANIKVIILTAYAEDTVIMESVKAGADGYVLKNIDGKSIIKAITDVYSGLSVLDSNVVNKVVRAVKEGNIKQDNLTPQEMMILKYIAEGKTNKEIGECLYLSEKTVRNSVSKILRKIKVNNRTEAAILWTKELSSK